MLINSNEHSDIASQKTIPMSREAKEAAINQKIEEIRRRNEEIIKRYQEIENDKKNAELFSQEEALERSKRGTQQPKKSTTTNSNSNDTRPKREPRILMNQSRVSAITNPTSTEDFVSYRPPRLSENDLPPEDPVYSYLTDRLREGAFCSPISPPKERKSSTGSQMSYSSGGSSSRKTSTASNSSWTSNDSSSSKCLGFSNYQPPRKYSACRDYIKNRRISGDYQMRQGKPIIDQEDTLQENREINTTVNDKKKGNKPIRKDGIWTRSSNISTNWRKQSVATTERRTTDDEFGGNSGNDVATATTIASPNLEIDLNNNDDTFNRNTAD